jgi:NADH dehydrogenase FAD-containing subunit
MIVPPFIGQDVVRSAGQIADEKGYVKVRDTYQTEGFDNVYAVGIAAAVNVPRQTATPIGVPMTGFPTERMAHVAARNIAAQIRGRVREVLLVEGPPRLRPAPLRQPGRDKEHRPGEALHLSRDSVTQICPTGIWPRGRGEH